MANTLKFGDGKWGAKKDSILAYNDENANFKPLPFTTSRASTATRINKAGLIEKVENGIPRVDYLGNTKGAMLLEPQSTNLIKYSEALGRGYWIKSGAIIQGDPSTAGAEQVVNGSFATDTDWNKEAGWSISSGKLIANTSSSTACYQVGGSTPIITGKTYQVKFEITSYTVGSVNLRAGTEAGITNFNTVGVHTVTMVAGGALQIRFASVGTTVLTIDNCSVKEVKGFASPSAETPLGAFKLVEDTSNGNHRFLNSPAISINGDFSNSVFAKKGERNFIRLVNNNLVGAFFDLQNGVVVSVSSGFTADIKNYGNGWYKCSINGNRVGTQSERLCVYSSINGVSDSYQGDGTSGVYIFGAQLEPKAYSTSYIPNYGESAGVTRLAESCSQTPISGVIGQTEGTMFLDFDFIEADGVKVLFTIHGNAGNKRIEFWMNNYVLNGFIGGSVNIAIGSTSIASGRYKAAIAYDENGNQAFYVNGIQIGTSLTPYTISELTSLIFNSYVGGSTYKTASNINNLQLYNTRLSNSELAALTTI